MQKKKILVFLTLVSLNFFLGKSAVGREKPYVYFGNVGQGDAEMIRTSAGQIVLVDGGPTAKVSELVGRKIPFYQRRIDALVLSHAHSDHFVGQIDILRRYEVGLVIWNGYGNDSPEFAEWLGAIKEKGVPLRRVGSGDYIKFDEREGLEILWPEKGGVLDDYNLSSLVFRFVGGKDSYLFTGDADAGVLEGLEDIQATVLKVPHHGSKTSLTAPVLGAISPEKAVIGVGQNNYGQPSPAILELLANLGARTYLTIDGPVTFSLE